VASNNMSKRRGVSAGCSANWQCGMCQLGILNGQDVLLHGRELSAVKEKVFCKRAKGMQAKDWRVITNYSRSVPRSARPISSNRSTRRHFSPLLPPLLASCHPLRYDGNADDDVGEPPSSANAPLSLGENAPPRVASFRAHSVRCPALAMRATAYAATIAEWHPPSAVTVRSAQHFRRFRLTDRSNDIFTFSGGFPQSSLWRLREDNIIPASFKG